MTPIKLFLGLFPLLFIIGCAEKPIELTAQQDWERYEKNPVLPVGRITAKPKQELFAIADPFVIFDQGKYRMWFAYGGVDPDKKARVQTGYATSKDGISWDIEAAPVLNVGKEGSWDEANAETPSVVKDDRLPDGHPRKYRLYYSGITFLGRDKWDGVPIQKAIEIGMVYGIGLAFSPDGKTFTRLPASESRDGKEGLMLKPNPFREDLAVDFFVVADPHVLTKDGKYHIWYSSLLRDPKTNTFNTGISYATSDDGIHWEKYSDNPVLRPSGWELDRSGLGKIGQPYVIWNGEKFEMWYSVDVPNAPKQGFHSAKGFGYAWSTDGKKWEKLPQPAFVPRKGLPGERDGFIVGNAVLFKDGTYTMYYTGLNDKGRTWMLNRAVLKSKTGGAAQ